MSNISDDWIEVDKDEIINDEDYNENEEEPPNKNYLTELLSDPKYKNLIDLKEQTENEIQKTVTNKNSSNVVKSLVSKKKFRFCYDGFDLDLSYITTKIIAMGYPSTSIESIYRNNLTDVQKFFNTRHKDHYKIYNLCEEKNYPKDIFYKQGYYPFKDHEVPSLNTIKLFCDDAKNFLEEDEKNVIGVHCLAGKGRTGTLIACLLLYLNIFETADECLKYFGLMRVGNGIGVTVPSQLRYLNYFEYLYKNNINFPLKDKKICIRKVKMYTVPSVSIIGAKIFPTFIIKNGEKNYKHYEFSKKESYGISEKVINFDISTGFPVIGDVLVTFFNFNLFSKDKICGFWFNTYFVPDDGKFEIKKNDIDKAYKDKKNEVFNENFKIELEYIFL